MVREPGDGWAKRIARIVMIGIDHDDRFGRPRVHDELADATLLVAGKRQLRIGLRSDRAIDVEPAIHHAHLDQPIDPRVIDQVIDVRFADTRANTDQQLVAQRRFQALHGLVQHAVATAPRIADDLRCLRH